MECDTTHDKSQTSFTMQGFFHKMCFDNPHFQPQIALKPQWLPATFRYGLWIS